MLYNHLYYTYYYAIHFAAQKSVASTAHCRHFKLHIPIEQLVLHCMIFLLLSVSKVVQRAAGHSSLSSPSHIFVTHLSHLWQHRKAIGISGASAYDVKRDYFTKLGLW